MPDHHRALFADPEHTAVLLVDLQKDFLQPQGRLPVQRDAVDPLLDCVSEVAAAADDAGVAVVHIVNAFPRWSVANLFRKFAAVAGTPGAALDERVPHRDAVSFPKASANAFTNPALETWLREREIEHLVVLGVYADACVRRTVEGARRLGFEVTVPRAGVASRSARAAERGLAAIARAGAATP